MKHEIRNNAEKPHQTYSYRLEGRNRTFEKENRSLKVRSQRKIQYNRREKY